MICIWPIRGARTSKMHLKQNRKVQDPTIWFQDSSRAMQWRLWELPGAKYRPRAGGCRKTTVWPTEALHACRGWDTPSMDQGSWVSVSNLQVLWGSALCLFPYPAWARCRCGAWRRELRTAEKQRRISVISLPIAALKWDRKVGLYKDPTLARIHLPTSLCWETEQRKQSHSSQPTKEIKKIL